MFVWDVGFCFAVDAVAFVALYEVEVFYDLSFIYVGVWVFLVVVFEVCGSSLARSRCLMSRLLCLHAGSLHVMGDLMVCVIVVQVCVGWCLRWGEGVGRVRWVVWVC